MAYFRVIPVSSLNTGIGNLFAALFAIFGEHFAQLRDGGAVKNQFVRHLDEHFFAQQHLQDFLRSLRFNRQLFEHCREAWNRETSALEFLLDQLLCFRFLERRVRSRGRRAGRDLPRR